MARFQFATLVTAVLALARQSFFVLAQSQSSGGCSPSSFTTPGWLVENFVSQSSANATVASYRALNRATNASVELRCQVPSSGPVISGWQRCSARNRTSADLPFVASFQTNEETAYFLFNETWACNDVPGRPLNFTAEGNSSIPITCSTNQSGSTACKATKPLLIQGRLLSPIKITPSSVAGPTGHDTKGCTANARTPAWEVAATQLNLQNVTGKLQGGNAFVIIRNEHLGYTASCGGVFTGGAAGPQAITCQGQTAYRRPEKYQISTVVLFEPETFALTVNQTWFCDDQDPSQPIAITASGTTHLDLACQTFPDSSTTFCTGGTSGSFPGNVTSRAILPPYALNDPLPTADGSCTISSVLRPAWWFDNFETNTTTAHSEVVTLRLGMELQIRGDGTSSGGGGGGGGGGGEVVPWNKCAFESVGDPMLAPTGCEFRYDMASRFLGMRVQWECEDLDPRSPVSFKGEVRTLLPDYTCVTSGTSIRCASPDPKPWRANVTSLTWQ
ncbi:uncharacterized protein B0T15DRAFT_412603 [Chaetomium strumarium]|uniref:Ig-like domain-containing protein n=1 Tax=Chaetomium strumarium TaxID=1170767 RepID=A0AAJ0GUI3_9PEZI|nr:hypothetical protein B0T15DRAFT_412603 [Chaetomium strumarium]